jgi:hypothetical protein
MERLLIEDVSDEFCREFCTAWCEEATIWPKCGHSIFDGPYCAWTVEEMGKILRTSEIENSGKIWCRIIRARVRPY